MSVCSSFFSSLCQPLSFCLSLCFAVCSSLLSVCQSFCVSPCLSICSSLYMSVCLFFFLPFYLRICPSIAPFVYLFQSSVFLCPSLPSPCLLTDLLVCSLGSLTSIDLSLVTTTAQKGMCNNLIKNICCCCCCFCCCLCLLLLPFTLQNVLGALSSSSGRTLCSNCHRTRQLFSSPRLPSSPLFLL